MKNYPLHLHALATLVDPAVWIGIDAHKSSLSVTVLNAAREIVERATVENKHAAVTALFKKYQQYKVTAVYEAGPTGYQLLRWLREMGIDAFMTAPSLVPSASGDRVKTDKKDSLKLATLLQGGQLKRIEDLSDEEYHDRELVRCRGRAVEARSDICRQIKSMLLMHGIPAPEELETSWSKKAVAALKGTSSGDPLLDLVLQEEIQRFVDADAAVQRMDKHVRALANKPKYGPTVARLETIPGIGRLSALGLATELQSMKRFRNAAALAAYLGLTPSEYSSGDRVHRGHITRQGNSRCRAILVEVVWRAIRQDELLAARFEALARRRGKKRAAVALARRLATILYAMLRDEKDWDQARVALQAP